MAAVIGHRPAAGLGAIEQPRSRLARLGVEPLERRHLREHRRADLAGGEDLLHPDHRGIEAAIVGDAERHAGAAGRLDHLVALGRVHRHRFLAEDVLPCFGRGDGLLRMEADRRGDIHGVDAGIGDELLPRGIRASSADLARNCVRLNQRAHG